MKIALCYSMQFAEQAQKVQTWFSNHGHQAYPSTFNDEFIGLTAEAKEALKLNKKNNADAIGKHFALISRSDRVLVLNYDKEGIANYIGGNVFLEMGFAYVLQKPLYLLNPIPQMPHYHTELQALRPVVIYGELQKILLPVTGPDARHAVDAPARE